MPALKIVPIALKVAIIIRDLKNNRSLILIQSLKKQKKLKITVQNAFVWAQLGKKPPKKDFPQLINIIKQVKKIGLETCMTLGMLSEQQAIELKNAGLDYYNHNIDTSKHYYSKIITTRSYQDRLDTLQHIINADMNVCCGGILGMGETRQDRIDMLLTLASLKKPPKSIPINKLITIKGTPLEHSESLDHFEFIRTVAITRIMFPQSRIRFAAGRESMSQEAQAWCFMAGANSIFLGDILLTANNPSQNDDINLLTKLAIKPPKKIQCDSHA